MTKAVLDVVLSLDYVAEKAGRKEQDHVEF
jgi:hypothetical protein